MKLPKHQPKWWSDAANKRAHNRLRRAFKDQQDPDDEVMDQVLHDFYGDEKFLAPWTMALTSEHAYWHSIEIVASYLRGIITEHEMDKALRQTDSMFGNPRFLCGFVDAVAKRR